MLTPKQLRTQLLCYHFCSKLGFIPFDINVKKGTITKTKSRKLYQLWWFWLMLAVLRGILGTIVLIVVLARPGKISMGDIPIVVIYPFCCAVGCFCFHLLLFRYSDTTVTAFNALSAGKQNIFAKISYKLEK